MTINIDNFNFYRNSKIIKELEEIGLLNFSIKFYEVLGLAKKSKYHKEKFINYTQI